MLDERDRPRREESKGLPEYYQRRERELEKRGEVQLRDARQADRQKELDGYCCIGNIDWPSGVLAFIRRPG